jgi:hypothetical protein
MKKSILKLGKTLNKVEQKQINGGKVVNCYDYPICPPYDELACIIIAGECQYMG